MSRIYLRALELEDYDLTLKWHQDEEISALVVGPRYFISTEREKEWIRNAIFDNEKLVLAICLKENDKHIGNVMLQDINYINRSAVVPVLVGDKDEWNKGYATEARLLMIKYAFEERGLYRITAHVIENNIGSIKMNEKCGFKVEGVMRQAIYKRGRFWDLYVMGVLRDEFDIAYNKYFARYNDK